jgi:hypothetical protein
VHHDAPSSSSEQEGRATTPGPRTDNDDATSAGGRGDGTTTVDATPEPGGTPEPAAGGDGSLEALLAATGGARGARGSGEADGDGDKCVAAARWGVGAPASGSRARLRVCRRLRRSRLRLPRRKPSLGPC